MFPVPTAASGHDSKEAMFKAHALLQVARGFTCMFWGIPASLLFMVGAVQLDFAFPFRLPTYFFGVLILYAGFFFLYRGAYSKPRWNRLAISGLLLSFAMVYFTPFFYWWKQSPFTPFFLLNMMALLAVCAGVLFTVNRLSAEIGRLLDDPVLWMEARMAAWVSLLILVPILVVAIGFALQAGRWGDATWIADYLQQRRHPPTWIYLCFILPVALTMTSAWKAKERCFIHMLHQISSSP